MKHGGGRGRRVKGRESRVKSQKSADLLSSSTWERMTRTPYNLTMVDPHVPRVMHVITPSRMAGAETFLARLLRRTSSDQVVARCVVSHSKATAEMRAAGMRFDVLGIGGKANLLAVPRLRRAAREYGAELLHSHLSSASWWCGWLEACGGMPSIGHVHGFTSALWHRRQSHLIACSAAVKAHLIENGIPANRITVMHNPVDLDDVVATSSPADVRAELGADADTPVVGTFAHLSVKKGYRELIRAADVVLRLMPRAQFWCFGEGVLRRELELAAEQAGIADRFKLFGFRRDVPDLMRAIDVMCLPSHREPFGLVYVEAALAGKPVIGSQAGGAPEIIEHGQTGMLVPSHDAAALADAILTLLDDRSTAAEMGRRGRQLALERFGWPRYLAQLREVYDRVLDERPGHLRHAARTAA
jgi:glycosyltransferase involved in cell wall biosynthesis